MEEWEYDMFMLYSHSKPYFKKIDEAKKVINEAIDMDKEFTISCSYGKDSIVLLDLIMNITKKFKVVQSDSGYQLPETYSTRDYFERKFNFRTNILTQLMPYEEFLTKYGMNGINRTESQHKKVVQETKKNRLDEFAKALGSQGTFWGMRKEESNGRKFLLDTRGSIYFNKTKQMFFISPLAKFNIKDIWAYIISNNLQYPAFYDYQNCGKTREWIRNKSWVTTDGAEQGELIWLKYNYPKLFNELSKKFDIINRFV